MSSVFWILSKLLQSYFCVHISVCAIQRLNRDAQILVRRNLRIKIIIRPYYHYPQHWSKTIRVENKKYTYFCLVCMESRKCINRRTCLIPFRSDNPDWQQMKTETISEKVARYEIWHNWYFRYKWCPKCAILIIIPPEETLIHT